MFRKTLYYCEVHFKEIVIAGIANKVSTVVYQILLPIFTIFSSFIILISVLSLLFWIDTKIALGSLLGFASIYILVALITKNRIAANGILINKKQDELIKNLQESFGAIRDTLTRNSRGKLSALR